jgi:hypothetical protein
MNEMKEAERRRLVCSTSSLSINDVNIGICLFCYNLPDVQLPWRIKYRKLLYLYLKGKSDCVCIQKIRFGSIQKRKMSKDL